MTCDEFKILRDLIHKESGIYLDENKQSFLASRTDKRLKVLNMNSYFQYYKYITGNNQNELKEFIDCVTINETYFFRNIPQFEMFREKVLPEVTGRKRMSREYNLVVWSAGCSTGEEAYSIAIELAESIPDAPLWNIKVLASDISLRCLDIASKGKYPPEKLRDVPEKYLSRYFRQNGEHFEVKEHIKKSVVFDYHNLHHENNFRDIDVIFCRNVMIYFPQDEQKQLVARFARALKFEGYLFIGHAESLQGITANGEFKFIYSNKGSAYQKVQEIHG